MFTQTLVFLRLLDRRTQLLLVLFVLATLCISALDLVGVAAVLPLVQVVSQSGDYSGYLQVLHRSMGSPAKQAFVVELAVVLVLAFALKAVAALLIKWRTSAFLMKREISLSAGILLAYQTESYQQHKARSLPEVFRDVSAVTGDAFGKVLTGMLNIVTELCTVALVGGLLLVAYPGVTLVAVLYFGAAAYGLQRMLARRNERLSHLSLQASMEVQRHLLQAVHGFREVKLYGLERQVNRRFREARLGMSDVGRRGNYLGEVPKYLLEVVFVIGLCMIILMFTVTVPAAGIVASIGLFAAAGIRILPSITRIVASLGIARSGRAGLDRTIQLLTARETSPRTLSDSASTESAPSQRAPQPGPREQTLRATGLRFSYAPEGPEVIAGVDFAVPFGTSLALCGTSGAGKTTLVDILLGLIQPTSGTVEYGGQEIQADLGTWYSRIGYVPQDVFLLDDSVAANIAFGVPAEDVDRAKVQQCLVRTELTGLVATLEQGMDTLVGERGTRLSGGQRQRLGLARALYTDPEVLFLDEATSALDNETERRITETIRGLDGEVTTVLVAHRLSTVRHADQLLFLKDGQVAARGSFTEVQRLSSEFAELVRLGRLD